METILVQPRTKADLKLLKDFLTKTSMKTKMLSDTSKEDIVLSRLMSKVNINDTIDTAIFLKKLRSK